MYVREDKETLEVYKEELATATSNATHSKIMEISKRISSAEGEIEKRFKILEKKQTQLDAIMKEYEAKMSEL